MILVSNWPALPTNGSPCRSSSAPGASPMNTSRALTLPTPKTVCVRVAANSAQRVQAATSRRMMSNCAGRSAAATICGAAAATVGEYCRNLRCFDRRRCNVNGNRY